MTLLNQTDLALFAEVDRAIAKPKRKRRDVCGHPRVDSTVLPQREQATSAVWCCSCGHCWIQVGGEL